MDKFFPCETSTVFPSKKSMVKSVTHVIFHFSNDNNELDSFDFLRCCTFAFAEQNKRDKTYTFPTDYRFD